MASAAAASLIPLPDPAKALEAAKAARAELDVLIAALEEKPELSSFANKNKVLASQLKLEHALRGPLDTYVSYILSNGDYTALHTASKLKIYHAIGDDEVTTAEISKRTGVNEGLIHRLLKVLETMNLAREVAPRKWALEEPAKCFYHPVFQGPGGVLCAGWYVCFSTGSCDLSQFSLVTFPQGHTRRDILESFC